MSRIYVPCPTNLRLTSCYKAKTQSQYYERATWCTTKECYITKLAQGCRLPETVPFTQFGESYEEVYKSRGAGVRGPSFA